MHVGDNGDRGGNDTHVQFLGRGSNMHAVWDTLLIEKRGKDEAEWMELLAIFDTAANRKRWQAGTVEDWATESLQAAKHAYRIPGTDDLVNSGQKLDEVHEVTRFPIVWDQLTRGGVGLAWMLNEALAD